MCLCRSVGYAIRFYRTLVSCRLQGFHKRLRPYALIEDTIARSHIHKTQICRKPPPNASRCTKIDNAWVGWCQFQERNDRRTPQIRRVTGQRNGMREYIVLFGDMMLGEIHTIAFFYKRTTLGHCR